MSLVLAAFCVPTVGWAQERLLSKDAVKEVKKTEGWDFLLTTGLSFSFSNSENTVGQLDGSSYALGVNILGVANFRSGIHELRNGLNINESYSRTPVIDAFLKANDVFKEESIYLIHFIEWLGPYVDLSLQTSMFESYAYNLHPDTVDWQVTMLNNTTKTYQNLSRLRMTDGFLPFRLKETIGAFAQPFADKRLNFEIRLGIGGLHVFATDQFAVNHTSSSQIAVNELETYSEAGGELGLGLWGELYEKRVTYNLNANFFMPIVYQDRPGQENGAFNLTNIDISAIISFNLLEWFSVDYQFKAVREPQLIDKFQIQNNLLLTVSYTFFKPPEPPKPEPVCTCPTCPACTCPPPEAEAPAPAPSE
jgi:hypothetical protein